jgi:hypothetical protein
MVVAAQSADPRESPGKVSYPEQISRQAVYMTNTRAHSSLLMEKIRSFVEENV